MTTTRRATPTTHTVESHRPGTYVINYDHRLDGPAHIGLYPDDKNDHLVTIWYNHGLQQRTGGPAITMSNGDIFWTAHDCDITRTEGRK